MQDKKNTLTSRERNDQEPDMSVISPQKNTDWGLTVRSFPAFFALYLVFSCILYAVFSPALFYFMDGMLFNFMDGISIEFFFLIPLVIFLIFALSCNFFLLRVCFKKKKNIAFWRMFFLSFCAHIMFIIAMTIAEGAATALFLSFLCFLLCGALANITVDIAKKKGRKELVLWWLYGTFLFPIALIHALLMSPIAATDGDFKQCPYCAEVVKKEARVCRYCGEDLV